MRDAQRIRRNRIFRSRSVEPKSRGPGVALRAEQLEGRTVLSAAPSPLLAANLSPPTSAQPQLAAVGNEVFFTAKDASGSEALWKTDGTQQGTVLVKDFASSAANSQPKDLIGVNGLLLFTAGDALWKSDGTASGTVEVQTQDGALSSLKAVGNTLFYTVNNDSSSAAELWASDGSQSGTREIHAFSAQQNLIGLTQFTGKLYFFDQDLASQNSSTLAAPFSLWSSDGTSAGTSQTFSFPGGIVHIPTFGASANSLYVDFDGQLWASDGTTAGQLQVASLTGKVTDMTDVGGALYFLSSGVLWTSDGTSLGTLAVPVIDPTGFGIVPSFENLYNVDGHLVLSGAETLYTIDANNNLVTIINNPGSLTSLGGGVQVDFVANGLMFFQAPDLNENQHLMVTDGTVAGTSTLGGLLSPYFVSATAGGRTYFWADDGTHGVELWSSDGTAAGTTLVTPPPGPFQVADVTYTIGSGTIVVNAVNGVLANDSGDQLTVTAGSLTGAQGGTFQVDADGSFTYIPASSFPGYDSVQVTVSDSQGHQGTATITVLSQHAAVVWKFYESVLNRTPDAGGLQYWTNYFNGGGSTGDMAFGFFESDELLGEVIADYYEQYLLRPLDSGGLSYWKGVWHATGGPEQIKAGFADSPEFYTSAGGTPQSWIAALYQRILNRTPDTGGE